MLVTLFFLFRPSVDISRSDRRSLREQKTRFAFFACVARTASKKLRSSRARNKTLRASTLLEAVGVTRIKSASFGQRPKQQAGVFDNLSTRTNELIHSLNNCF